MTAEEARLVQEIKSRGESNTHQIEELKERMSKQETRSEMLYQMNENIALMAQSLKQVEGDIGEVKENQEKLSEKVSTLENAPAKDTMAQIAKVKWSVVSAIAGAIGISILWFVIENLSQK